MLKKLLFNSISLLLLLFFSCKKDITGYPSYNQYSKASFSQVFESFWTGMNNNYVWWSQDTVNWDNKYRIYKPLFDSLNINSSSDQQKSVTYFTDMTAGLIDSHYYISFDSSTTIFNTIIKPSLTRKANKIHPSLKESYFIDTLLNFLDSGAIWGRNDFIDTSGHKKSTSNVLMVTGTINHDIIYFHFNFFYVQLVHDSMYLNKVWNQFLSYLDTLAPDATLKGFIIDLRSNNGGRLSDLSYVFGRLINQPISFGFTRQKSGSGRLDYTPWISAIFQPYNNNSTAFKKPIVVLTDQNSVSMAELTTMALKMLPNTYVIGDTTWGATGPLNTEISLYQGGQFHFANSFGFVYTSSVQFKYNDGKIYEGKGFPPDEYVPINQDSLNIGRDAQLNAAVRYLNK